MMYLSHPEIKRLINKVKKEYVELNQGGKARSHEKKVSFYALRALDKLEKETEIYIQKKYK